MPLLAAQLLALAHERDVHAGRVSLLGSLG